MCEMMKDYEEVAANVYLLVSPPTFAGRQNFV